MDNTTKRVCRQDERFGALVVMCLGRVGANEKCGDRRSQAAKTKGKKILFGFNLDSTSQPPPHHIILLSSWHRHAYS